MNYDKIYLSQINNKCLVKNNNNNFNKLTSISVLLVSAITICFANNYAYSSVFNAIEAHTNGLKPAVLKLALKAHENAEKYGQTKSNIETVVDFTMPSSQKRLWVINTETGQVLYNTWVTHGSNSGMGAYATRFSNRINSHESSIGVYKTGVTYNGKNGYSLHLFGLDKGFNDNAYARSVVVHGAPYVSSAIVKKYDEVGHSWGCFAVSEALHTKIINKIKNDSILVAYYPNKAWLSSSRYV